MVLNLGAAAISNQIKYYFTTNRGKFLEMQYGFYRYALLAVFYDFLMKEHLPRTQEKLDQDCLELHCERSLKYASKFVFIDRRSRDCERPGLWYALLFELMS